MPAASEVETLRIAEDRLDDVRTDPGQGEEAEHDARDARQDLEDRLDDLADAVTGVLGQVDRAREADRGGDHHRDDRDDERAGQDSRSENMPRRGNQPSPEELAEVDLAKEIAWVRTVRTIPALIRIETVAAANRTARIAPSLRRRAAVPRRERMVADPSWPWWGHVVRPCGERWNRPDLRAGPAGSRRKGLLGGVPCGRLAASLSAGRLT